ncbi:COP9 signalosome complex subunit 8 [Sparassis crispa]|uniref:COP9 signalosome complex subunit 8 n=1 Tax=Sparassis crispa TaxID=139825 RepID=A0A401GHN0_9APHY|nr:COP9 signalosome complex subunit 8 [Sparassis crispa]GBE81700.1 COP9 signalosome complex subunit 8 [Sparassis crispa]
MQVEEPSQVAEPAPQTVAAPEQQKNLYELLFPTLANLAAKGDFQELIRVAEHWDVSAENNSSYSRLFLTAPLVLSYLIVDELSAARYALTRLPDNLASLPITRGLFHLLSATWDRKYQSVYSRAEDVFNLCHQPGFPDDALASMVTGMVTTFVDVFRKKTFVLLSKAYTSIPLSLSQTYLGLSSEQVINAAGAHGWTYDASTRVFTPTSATAGTSRLNGASAAQSTLYTFGVVADSIVRLEM